MFLNMYQNLKFLHLINFLIHILFFYSFLIIINMLNVIDLNLQFYKDYQQFFIQHLNE